MFDRRAVAEHGAFAVTGDDAGGAAAIARRFLETGHRRMAFVAGISGWLHRSRARSGLRGDADERRPPTRPSIPGGFNRTGGAAAVRASFADPARRPDALFRANEVMAIETQRAGFGIGPDRARAVAGFDNIPMAAWPGFAPTTYAQRVDAMVAHALAFLLGERADAHGAAAGRLVIRATA